MLGLELADDMESLLGMFMDVGDVLIKCQFIVYSESEVFKTSYIFYNFVMGGGGNWPKEVMECKKIYICIHLETFLTNMLL